MVYTKNNNLSNSDLMNIVLDFCIKTNIDQSEISLLQLKEALSGFNLSASKLSNILKICTELSDEYVTGIIEGTYSIDEVYRNRNFIKKYNEDHIPVTHILDTLTGMLNILGNEKCNVNEIIVLVEVVSGLFRKKLISKKYYRDYLHTVSNKLSSASYNVEYIFEKSLKTLNLSVSVENKIVSIGIIEY